MKPLGPDFYARDTVDVARDLLGCVLESRIRGGVVAGRIVEVEAYLGVEDPAAHSYRGRRTERTEPMFGPPGTSYVYFTYGMHWCFNVVTAATGIPAAVLIRALEPTVGLTVMQRRRQTRDIRHLCSGPARLCQALAVTGACNGHPLDRGRLVVKGPPDTPVAAISASPRIGISRAVDWPLRFVERDSRFLSRRR